MEQLVARIIIYINVNCFFNFYFLGRRWLLFNFNVVVDVIASIWSWKTSFKIWTFCRRSKWRVILLIFFRWLIFFILQIFDVSGHGSWKLLIFIWNFRLLFDKWLLIMWHVFIVLLIIYFIIIEKLFPNFFHVHQFQIQWSLRKSFYTLI